jgi:hypothetical protein
MLWPSQVLLQGAVQNNRRRRSVAARHGWELTVTLLGVVAGRDRSRNCASGGWRKVRASEALSLAILLGIAEDADDGVGEETSICSGRWTSRRGAGIEEGGVKAAAAAAAAAASPCCGALGVPVGSGDGGVMPEGMVEGVSPAVIVEPPDAGACCGAVAA